jgi:hypothetical protein
MFGCDGYLTNARASNTTLLLHCGRWSGGRTWTAGCGWLAHFLFDQWQFIKGTAQIDRIAGKPASRSVSLKQGVPTTIDMSW